MQLGLILKTLGCSPTLGLLNVNGGWVDAMEMKSEPFGQSYHIATSPTADVDGGTAWWRVGSDQQVV